MNFTSVVHIEGNAHLEAVLREAQGRLVVVDFTSQFCGPCRNIEPAYQALPQQYPNVVFTSVDHTKAGNSQVHSVYQVTATPTYVFFIKGREIERFRGARIDQLHSTVTRLLHKIEDDEIAEAIRMSMSTSESNNTNNKVPEPPKDDNDPEPVHGKSLNVKVKRISSDDFEININENAKVQHLRRRISAHVNVSVDSIRLIFKGKILKDDSTIASYGIKEDGLTIHLAISGKAATQEVVSSNTTVDSASSSGNFSNVNELKSALLELESKNGKTKAKDAIQVMVLYVRNITTHPDDIKYRSIRMGNSKFSSKIGSCEGGVVCMQKIGFEIKPRDGENYLVLSSGIQMPNLNASLSELNQKYESLASTLLSGSSVTSSTPANFPNAETQNAGNPFLGMGANPFGASPFGAFPNAGNAFPSSLPAGIRPEMLQAMQSNPALQNASMQMTRRLMENPQLMQDLMSAMASGQDPMAAMMSNPSTMELVGSMMSDPALMSSLSGSMGGVGSPGSSFLGQNSSISNASNNTSSSLMNTQNSNTGNNNDTSNDDDLDDLDDIYADEK